MNGDRSAEVVIHPLLRPQWPFVLLAMTALVFAATPLMYAQSANPLEGDARVSWVMRWEGGLCVRMAYECCAVQMCSR